MNNLEGLGRYQAELMTPMSPDYRIEHYELSEAYRVELRLATGVEHAKRTINGLCELHEYINRAGIAHPAVLAMARELEATYFLAARELMSKRMRGRSV